ncbi:MAG: DUF350 domain-containing protein [Boseongicola sp.]|nr:DUF350 domain-containing protein [Silicimonas sp.]NNF90661.1 DUF350 domain-containing protein [Boseongicola sp.]NNL73399.1 DUF350 domain-containing protein [Silicimonas sp.]
MLANIIAAEVVATIFYTLLGLLLLGVSWKLIEWLSPFSLRQEIEEDQNLAIAVLIGSLFISISILISAVILS